jgi:hypothetical protein
VVTNQIATRRLQGEFFGLGQGPRTPIVRGQWDSNPGLGLFHGSVQIGLGLCLNLALALALTYGLGFGFEWLKKNPTHLLNG